MGRTVKKMPNVMGYKRLKLKYGYHDAMVWAIRYQNREVILDVELCSCCNASPGPATISFLDVRNFEMVQEALESARRENIGRAHIDEIIGIVRSEDRGILLDLHTAGGVQVDAQGIVEA